MLETDVKILDKYRDEFGQIEWDDVSYDDAVDGIMIGLLEWCGCGEPEVAARQIRDGLVYKLHLQNGAKVETLPLVFVRPAAEHLFDAIMHRQGWLDLVDGKFVVNQTGMEVINEFNDHFELLGTSL